MSNTGDPTAPIRVPATAPAPGWFPAAGELRWWDGQRWTEHRRPLVAAEPSPSYPVARPVQVAPTVFRDTRTNSVELAVAWVLAVSTFGYLLPWAIAATRGKSNSIAVGLVNLFLGWTLLGWGAALVMACSAHQVAFVQPR